MANIALHPAIGTRTEMGAMRHQVIPHAWAPETVWRCRLLASDLAGAAATQTSVVTIPAAGFVSGRLSATFTGGGLPGPVTVVADALSADTNLTLSITFEAAVATARGGSLAGVVASETVTTNATTINYVQGIGAVEVALLFTPSQITRLSWGGADLEDGDYTMTFTGGGLGGPVPVVTSRVGAVPATNPLLAVQAEADIEAEAGLAAVVQSADDSGATNSVIMFPGIASVAIAITVPQFPMKIDSQFGGTETDGDYVHTFKHASLPPQGVLTTTTRAVGVPATNLLLAGQAENDIESTVPVALLVATADTDGVDTAQIRTYHGVTGLVVETSAPAPGTLVATDITDGPTLTMLDSTPAAPVVTIAHTVAIDLNEFQPNDAFPAPTMRGHATINVTEAFPGGSVATLDDNGAASTDVLFAVAIDSLGWVGDTGTSLGRDQKTEGGWTPRLAVDLGTDPSPATGDLVVQVYMSPLPE